MRQRISTPVVAFGVSLLTLSLAAAAAGQGARTAAAGTRVVTLDAEDYRFHAPDRIRSGATTFRLINRGKEPHHAVLVKLSEPKTADEIKTAFATQGPPPKWATFMGGPNAGMPGGTVSATVVLRPGNYAWICVIPSSQDGKPHLAHGMVHTFTVTPGSGPNVLPAADLAVLLSDYDFQVSKPLQVGRYTLRVRNQAPQWHEMTVLRLVPGRTLDEALAWAEKPSGPPPFEMLDGAGPMDPRQSNNVTVNLTPGNYALVCFLPDGKDGRPHFLHGMKKEFRVES